MKTMKAFSGPAGSFVQWVGLLLIALLMLYVIIQWGEAGAHVQRGLEQGSIMYSVANSVSALSSMGSGEVSRYLLNTYDLTVRCDGGSCFVRARPYDSSGNPGEESQEVLILGNIEPASLKEVNRITLSKEPGGKVVLTGERVEDAFRGILVPGEYPTMCITTHPDIAGLLADPEINQGLEPELLAAIIQAESSWQEDAYRYEPGYQFRYLEGSEWEQDSNWLSSGPTVDQWLGSHPSRQGESEGLSEEQLSRTAQTSISASYGLMQLMYPTAVQSCRGASFRGSRVTLGSPDDLYGPALNIFCGARHLKSLQSTYQDLRDQVSAYNAGQPRWTTSLANREYTARVLGYYNAYRGCVA